jgi:hypothetical protein
VDPNNLHEVTGHLCLPRSRRLAGMQAATTAVRWQGPLFARKGLIVSAAPRAAHDAARENGGDLSELLFGR